MLRLVYTKQHSTRVVPMPNYLGPLGHRNQCITLSIAMTPVPFLAGDWHNIFLPVGCLLGLWIHPDWDIDPGAMGWIGKLQFVDEYAAIVPHRHKLSHTPVLGTAIRFLATFLIPVLLLGLVAEMWLPPRIALSVFAGLCLADSLHVSTDLIKSAIKTRRRTWKKRRRS